MVLELPNTLCLFPIQLWALTVLGNLDLTLYLTEYQVRRLIIFLENLNKRQKLFSETITEILCYNPGGRCGGSNYYNCKQMKAKMLVGHTDKEWRVRTLRNITINIGCSCVYREPVLLNQFIPGPEERKKRSER